MSALQGRLDCFDGRYRFVCEQGHHVSYSGAYLDTCPAVIPWSPDGANNGPPCGAAIEYREVDYRGEDAS